MAVRTAEHTLSTSDGPMRLYESLPEGEVKGAVVVIMEAFGVNDHIEDVTRRAAAAGYHAVAPDLFHRAGGGTAPYDDFGKVMGLFQGVDADGVLVDVDAALDHLRAAGFGDGQIGITGFCFGGWVTFLVAARRAIGAASTYYGGGIVSPGGLPFPALFEETATLKTPWQGHFGDKDAMIPVDDVEKLKAELARANPVPHEVHRYDADHGFHCDGRPAAFDETASATAWARTLDWFGTHLHA